jgi:hypothetical protein
MGQYREYHRRGSRYSDGTCSKGQAKSDKLPRTPLPFYVLSLTIVLIRMVQRKVLSALVYAVFMSGLTVCDNGKGATAASVAFAWPLSLYARKELARC